jgi:group I intron endonuclease
MKTREQVIYCITNKIDGKKYIGSTIDFRIRRVRHLSDLRCKKHHSSYLQNAFNKYGEDNFEFEILERVDDVNFLIEIEQRWLDNENPEYNMTLIAGFNSHLGRKRSDETKRKISEALTGIKRSDETKKRISDSQKGVPKDGTNMNKDKINVPLSESHKNKISLANTGKIVTDKVKHKISETLKRKNLQSAISIEIKKYSLDGELLDVYPSMVKAENENGIGRGLLYYHLIKMGRTKYKNFIWLNTNQK